MKFTLKSTNGSGRLGIISNITRLPDFEMETPHALLYTQGGTVPHLSHEVLQKVTTKKLGLNIPIQSISNLQGRLKTLNLDISQYIGMKEYFSYCTFIDPGEKRVEGYHEKNKISVWTKMGRKTYTSEEYIKFIEELKPDIFVALADGDTTSESSKKRITKAAIESELHFEKCLKLYNESEILKTSQILGAVEGGYDIHTRESFSKIIGESPVFGAMVDGLHDCSDSVLEMDSEQIKEIVRASLKHIPDDKLRIIHGSWNPKVLLELVELGIDLFDTSFSYYITQEAGALIFPNTESILEQCVLQGINGFKQGSQIINEDSKSSNDSNEGPVSKRIKLITKSIYHISMMNTVHKTDFSPILKNCKCYTCTKHTRAYIHHLMTVEELLGSTLLMIHNLHHYYQFLSSIRRAISSGKFKEFKKMFKAWTDKAGNESSPT